MLGHYVHHQHADKGTKYHCIYGYYYHGLNTIELGRLICKSPSTVRQWIIRYKTGKDVTRMKSSRQPRITSMQATWILQFFFKFPTSYLNECQSKFWETFSEPISITTIWTILHNGGFTFKKTRKKGHGNKD